MTRRIAAAVLCLVLLDVEVACSPLRTLAPAVATTATYTT